MGFRIVGIEADDKKGNKYKHCFYDAGDGSYLAFYDLSAFGTRALSAANTDVTRAMGLGPQYVHMAWEARDEDGLNVIAARWLRCGLEYVESRHHKDWMHSIYTFDPNGLMVEWAYATGPLGSGDARQAYELFVENKGIDEVGFEREGTKNMQLHLPDPTIEKRDYYVPMSRRLFNRDADKVDELGFVTVVQH